MDERSFPHRVEFDSEVVRFGLDVAVDREVWQELRRRFNAPTELRRDGQGTLRYGNPTARRCTAAMNAAPSVGSVLAEVRSL